MYCSVNDSAKMTAFVNISRLITPRQWNLGSQFVKVNVSCLITFHSPPYWHLFVNFNWFVFIVESNFRNCNWLNGFTMPLHLLHCGQKQQVRGIIWFVFFLEFVFFCTIEKYFYGRVLLRRESIKIPLQIFSGFNLLAALEAFQNLFPNPNNNICMFIL